MSAAVFGGAIFAPVIARVVGYAPAPIDSPRCRPGSSTRATPRVTSPSLDVAALMDLLPDNGIMSPYDGLPSAVVVTVWGAQLAIDR